MAGDLDKREASSSESSSVSSTLLDQLRTLRPDAWERFVRLYSPIIYRWCRRAGLSAEDAADVLQEVLAAVMLYLPDFRREGPQDSFSGWLATITRNKVRELYRRRQGKAEARGGSTAMQQMAEIAESAETDLQSKSSEEHIQPDAQSAACLSRRVLELIRAEFEARTWDVFWRVSVGGESPAHVAADLKMNVAAVYKAKSRVLGRFRQILAELPE